MQQVQPASNNPAVEYASPYVLTAPLAPEPRRRLWPALGWPKHLIISGVLLGLVAAAFSNSFKSGMTLDNKYIIEEYYKALLRSDPKHDLKSWNQVKLIFQNDYWWPKGISGLYRPITTFTYWIDYVFLTGKAVKTAPHDNAVSDVRKGEPIDNRGVPLRLRKLDDPYDPQKLSWYEYAYAPGLLKTTSYHWINLLVHWINAVLVYFVALVLLQRPWPATCVAALFATHPITTESVTNIIGRADLFAATCVFGGLLLYARSTRSRGLWRTPWLTGLMLICAFGFFSKESAVAIGLVVPLYWFTYEFDWRRPNWWQGALKELAVWCVMLPPLIGMFAARDWVFRNSSPAETPFLDNPIRGIWMVRELGLPSFEEELKKKPLPGMSFIECKMTAVKVMGKLLLLLLWPWTLCSDYSFHQIPNFSWHLSRWEDWKAVVAMLTMMAIGFVAWRAYSRSKALFFFILFFFLAALPTSNLIITIGSVMAERFMYLPLAGFVGVVVMAAFWLARKTWEWPQLCDRGGFRGFNFAAGAFLSMVVVTYGVRGWFRNFAWESDLTLWRTAAKDSPLSFRSYQSLAFALYEQDATGNIDQMIATAEEALPIVNVLPNHLNSSRLYLHLGMYYAIKGELLSIRNPDGTITLTREGEPWFRKSVAILQQGSQVDRAFNEVNKAKQRRRGDKEEIISDAGLGPVYATLGLSYTRLGMFDQALNSFQYQRQLEPGEVDAYIKIASVYLAQQKHDLAAISMMQAVLLDPSRKEVWGTLAQLYAATGVQGAIVMEGGTPKLNLLHPVTKDHLCAAYRDFVRVFRRAKRQDMAQQAATVAVDTYHFPRSLFDPLLTEPIPVVTPHGIEYPQ